MKKILFVLIISQFFIFCRDEKKNITIEKHNPFMGKWSFIIQNGYNCYKCNKIEFGKNGTGNLIISSAKEIKFTYKLLPENKIKFDFNKGETQSLFEQSEVFYYENGTVDNFEQIDLLRIEDKYNIHTFIRNLPN